MYQSLVVKPKSLNARFLVNLIRELNISDEREKSLSVYLRVNLKFTKVQILICTFYLCRVAVSLNK